MPSTERGIGSNGIQINEAHAFCLIGIEPEGWEIFSGPSVADALGLIHELHPTASQVVEQFLRRALWLLF